MTRRDRLTAFEQAISCDQTDSYLGWATLVRKAGDGRSAVFRDVCCRPCLCCIPFFTYGQSIGDVLEVTVGTGQHRVLVKSGHRTIRLGFTGDHQAHEQHQVHHATLIGELGCGVEFNGVRYWAIDLVPDVSADQVIEVMTPHHDAGYLMWEWADPAGPASE